MARPCSRPVRVWPCTRVLSKQLKKVPRARLQQRNPDVMEEQRGRRKRKGREGAGAASQLRPLRTERRSQVNEAEQNDATCHHSEAGGCPQ
eukprot:365940-Chlamydomonas_euryale.AAC.3